MEMELKRRCTSGRHGDEIRKMAWNFFLVPCIPVITNSGFKKTQEELLCFGPHQRQQVGWEGEEKSGRRWLAGCG